MVITRDGVYFTLEEGNDVVRDYIPLHETKEISMKRDDDDGPWGIPTEKGTLRFFVETIKDGYNSGRTYTIQTQSPELCSKVVSLLSQYAQKARSAALTRTHFEKSQQLVLKIHNSLWYQSAATTLILAVRQKHPQIPYPSPASSLRPIPSGCPPRILTRSRAELRAQHLRGPDRVSRHGADGASRRRARGRRPPWPARPRLRPLFHRRARRQPLRPLAPALPP